MKFIKRSEDMKYGLSHDVWDVTMKLFDGEEPVGEIIWDGKEYKLTPSWILWTAEMLSEVAAFLTEKNKTQRYVGLQREDL